MKCDGPKVYKVYTTRNEGAFGFCEGADPTDIELEHESVCLKSDVDKFIAELKSENKILKEHIANGDVSRITWIDEATELKAENECLKAKFESVQATAYADSVDAGMRERRLRRTLWLARANRAIEKIAWFKLWNAGISTMNPEDGARQEFDKWKKNLGKFLSKAEVYR